MDELLKAALKIQKNDDDELEKLLSDSGFALADVLAEQTRILQDGIEDIFFDDQTKIIDLATSMMKKSKLPSDKKINKILVKRGFEKEFELNTKPIFESSLDKYGKAYSKKFGTTFDFEKMSEQVRTEFDNWMKELPRIVGSTTNDDVTKILKEAFEKGHGIKKVQSKLTDSYSFSFKRARAIALTEMLTMQSNGAYENFLQTDTIESVRWRHSEGLKHDRPHHLEMDGLVIKKGEEFELKPPKGGTYHCLYPRQPNLPASERVFCHCWLEPVLSEEYTKEEMI